MHLVGAGTVIDRISFMHRLPWICTVRRWERKKHERNLIIILGQPMVFFTVISLPNKALWPALHQ